MRPGFGTAAAGGPVAAWGGPGVAGRVRAVLAPGRGAGREPAADRVLRAFGLVIGLAGTIAALLELPEIVLQHRGIPLLWSVLTVSVAFGMLPVLAGVSLLAGPRSIRPVAGAAALGYLAAMVLLLAYLPPIAAAPGPVWAYRLMAIGVLAAALAWHPLLAGGYLVLAVALPGASLYFLLGDTSPAQALDAFARDATLCLLVLWCVVYARRAGARVDRETMRSSELAAAVAGAAARERERARFAALIHDAVLSTLLDASRTAGQAPVLRDQAQRALDQLDETRIVESQPAILDADSVAEFLRSAVREVSRSVEFTVRQRESGATLRMPWHAAGTVAAALTEATRNSLRHAGVPGRTVRHTVTVTVDADGLRVVVRDDGAGFDLHTVPSDRLGVSVSILGRMRQLPGGAGSVDSAPGAGTTVTLRWAGHGEDGDARAGR
ncbi:ATP-binding protein [Nocardia rhamnosiphila]|uniref:sensor histidine kinase n=1 Tax=Nocardia rhamnosiphila TaxID=426716 RepID=UPI0034041920